MLIIDTHCHTADNWEEPIESLLYQMDANGVSHAVLAQMWGHFDNSYVLDCARRYGNRFKAVVCLDAEDKSRTKTLEGLHKQGAAGLRINLRQGVDGLRKHLRREWDPNDPVFKVAGERGMVVSVIGTVEHFASTDFKKLLANFPKTQFCLEHLARDPRPGFDFSKPPHDGYKASLECARWPNTTIKVPGLGELVKRPIRFPDGFPLGKIPPLFEMAKEAFGVQRMMWASNYPPCSHLEGYRNALQWVRDYPAFQNGDDIEWIMGKSAAKLWGFPS